MGYRLDLAPYQVPVRKEVTALDDVDVCGSFVDFLWEGNHWTPEQAIEVKGLTDRVEALGEDKAIVLTDRERDLVMEAFGTARGMPREAVPFLRRLRDMERMED